jgi:hypothetical protein
MILGLPPFGISGILKERISEERVLNEIFLKTATISTQIY